MPKPPKNTKTTKVKPTLMQKAAAKHWLANGGSLSDSMRAVGYTESMARNSQKLSTSKGFIKILEKAGLSDESLAQGHYELLASAHIVQQKFPAIIVTKTITKDDKGRPLKKPKTETAYKHISDEDIKMMIESVPGHKVLVIYKGHIEKTVMYQAPENAVRKMAIEMGYKVKDHFAAEKFSVVDHELDESERNLLQGIMIK